MQRTKAKARFVFSAFFICFFTLAGTALASRDLDERYRLDSISYLQVFDEVDGAFSDAMKKIYEDYLTSSSQFVFEDPSPANQIILKSKLGLKRVLDDSKIIAQVAKSLKVDTILRTKIEKESKAFRITIDWLLMPDNKVIAAESFLLPTSGREHEIGLGFLKRPVETALKKLFEAIPFRGQVTGVDDKVITLNLGRIDGIHVGDLFVVGTISEVKNHPLLNAIVGWNLEWTGKIQVDEVDESISYGHIVSEEPGAQILKYQKVTEVVRTGKTGLGSKTGQVGHAGKSGKGSSNDATASGDSGVSGGELAESSYFEEHQPRIARIKVSPFLGLFSRQFSQAALMTKTVLTAPDTYETQGSSGSGMQFGLNAKGELLLTDHWFIEPAIAFSLGSSTLTTVATATVDTAEGSIKSTLLRTHLVGGYQKAFSKDFFGPRAWAKVGIQTASFSLADSPTHFSSPVSFIGPLFLFGGDLPLGLFSDQEMIRRFSVNSELGFGLFTSGGGTQSFTTAVIQSASHFRFSFGTMYHFKKNLKFTFDFEFMQYGATYSNSGTLTHRLFNFIPGVVIGI